MSGSTSLVVPTLGRSPDLGEALRRLAAQAAPEDERVLVHPTTERPPDAGSEWRSVGVRARGFAPAANAGLAATHGEWVALVNDDAGVEPGWLDALRAELERDPGLAAVQGVNLRWNDPGICDGWGLGWNRLNEAVQLGEGGPPPPDGAPFETFGVSATAALYRRAALESLAGTPGGAGFETRLESWYEDVDLAVRLRARGWRTRCVPAARTLHRGSATGATMPWRRAVLVGRNRWLVAARLFGRSFPREWPRLLRADLRSLRSALARGAPPVALGALMAGASSVPRLGAFLRSGQPLVSRAELARFRVGSRA